MPYACIMTLPRAAGSMLVNVPPATLWDFASQVQYWPSWNPLFVSVNVTELELCGPFPAAYSNAPKLPFPPGIVGPHVIVELSNSSQTYLMAWEFKIIVAATGEV